MVHLSEIKFIETIEGARIESQISIDNQTTRTLWVETSHEYTKYLTYERADAFIVGMLSWAMREGHDIYSESPMSEYLYYQITTYLIPGLLSGSPRLHNIKIHCPISSEKLPNTGFVGTGITCGVDSLYSVCTNESDEFPLHKITHLTFFNVGSNGEGTSDIFKERVNLAQRFCIENGYPLVIVNSNLQDIIKQSHFLTATFSASFAILSLQKMWSLYYLASAGNDYEVFTLKDNDLHCSEDYELFLLPLLSTDQLRIESSGAGVTRQNKLKKIIDYAPSYNSLNVCVWEAANCSRCEKCIRTMVGLEALGSLEKYAGVFDLEFYKANKNHCYKIFLQNYYEGWKLHAEIYNLIKDKIPFSVKAGAYFLHLRRRISRHIPQNIKNRIKGV